MGQIFLFGLKMRWCWKSPNFYVLLRRTKSALNCTFKKEPLSIKQPLINGRQIMLQPARALSAQSKIPVRKAYSTTRLQHKCRQDWLSSFNRTQQTVSIFFAVNFTNTLLSLGIQSWGTFWLLRAWQSSWETYKEVGHTQLMSKILLALPQSFKCFQSAWDLLPDEEKTVATLTSKLVLAETMNRHYDVNRVEGIELF